mmetsp:Transcript_137942/g.384732  ORF Transcript_137942/g.384732 Transcript_137942/m.384732 type:complete len:242 (+) Transcript_137942:1666-2391(+)
MTPPVLATSRSARTASHRSPPRRSLQQGQPLRPANSAVRSAGARAKRAPRTPRTRAGLRRQGGPRQAAAGPSAAPLRPRSGVESRSKTWHRRPPWHRRRLMRPPRLPAAAARSNSTPCRPSVMMCRPRPGHSRPAVRLPRSGWKSASLSRTPCGCRTRARSSREGRRKGGSASPRLPQTAARRPPWTTASRRTSIQQRKDWQILGSLRRADRALWMGLTLFHQQRVCHLPAALHRRRKNQK